MTPLEFVNLIPLMRRGGGRREIAIGLIDGPVLMSHPDLCAQNIRAVSPQFGADCSLASSSACGHGTSVAGILSSSRGSIAPAICPDCTLLVRPIFSEDSSGNGNMPTATTAELAEAIVDCVNAGARLLNISAAVAQPSVRGESALNQALDYAASRGVISVAAGGNQGQLGSSAITRHPSVIPVAACDLQGSPLGRSNLGRSIGNRGLLAPGEGIMSLGTSGKPVAFGGTSAAAPFVAGTIALLWSEFPNATSIQVRFAVTKVDSGRRRSVTPPILDAWSAFQRMNVSLQ